MEKTPHVTKRDLEQWQDLEDRRLAAKRLADDLSKQQDAIEAKLEAFVRAKEPATLTVLRSGYRLSIRRVKSAVAWKQEFVKVAGQRVAEELTAGAPLKEKFAVERL